MNTAKNANKPFVKNKIAVAMDQIITYSTLVDLGACRSGVEATLDTIGSGIKFGELLLKMNRPDWILWGLRKANILDKAQWVDLAIISARSVISIYEKCYPNDFRPRNAINAASKYIKNPTEGNRAHAADAAAHAAYAADAAYAAANAADAAAHAAYAAANAADAAAHAAYAAANAADAAYAAAHAAYAAAHAAANAAYAAANAAYAKRLCKRIVVKVLSWAKKGE